VEYFAERALPVRQFVSEHRSDAILLERLKTVDLSECAAVLFEYEIYAQSMRYLEANHPGIRRIVRAHNANLPHFADQLQGRLRMLAEQAKVAPIAPFDDARQALVRYALDRECAALADAILPICDWEREHYWSHLASCATVSTLPYFIPRHLCRPTARPIKRNLVVFMMGVGGLMTPLLYDAGRNATELVNALPGTLAGTWRFAITGKIKPRKLLGKSSRMEQTGLLDSPLPLLAQARAVAILSDLGMGFKTKLLEAAMAGCWLLVTPDLLARVPDALRPWCLAVEPNSVEQFGSRLRECESRALPDGDPNRVLREEAFRSLDATLGIGFGRLGRPPIVSEAGSTC